MRAFQLTGDDLASLQPVELAMPEPGPGQVLVRLGASSLNYRDLAIARREYLPHGASATASPATTPPPGSPGASSPTTSTAVRAARATACCASTRCSTSTPS